MDEIEKYGHPFAIEKHFFLSYKKETLVGNSRDDFISKMYNGAEKGILEKIMNYDNDLQ